MTDELRARCVELLESYGIPTDLAPQLEAELKYIRHEREMVKAVPGQTGRRKAAGRTELRNALAKKDRAIKLLEEAARLAPQWPSLKTEAVKLRESADTKRKALEGLGRRQDFPKSGITSFDLERQVSRLGSFWKTCGKSTTRSVDWRGCRDWKSDKFGKISEGGQFVGFLVDALELIDMRASPHQIAHAIRSLANVDPERSPS